MPHRGVEGGAEGAAQQIGFLDPVDELVGEDVGRQQRRGRRVQRKLGIAPGCTRAHWPHGNQIVVGNFAKVGGTDVETATRRGVMVSLNTFW